MVLIILFGMLSFEGIEVKRGIIYWFVNPVYK